MRHKIYVLFWVCLFSFSAYSQDRRSYCETKLKEASRAYEEGKINDVRNLLIDEDCLKELDKVKRAEAYHLLALSGLYTDNRDMSYKNMEQFIRLSISPKFALNRGKGDGAEAPEFVELYDKFNVKPVYLYGLKLGVTYSLVNPTKIFSVDNNTEAGTYTPRIGFLIGGMFDLPITENLHAGAEAYYATRGFVHTDSILGFAKTEFTERQAIVEIPLYARYIFGTLKSNFRPFVSAGIFGNFLLSANGEVIRNDRVGSGATETRREVERLVVDMGEQRRKIGYGAILGTGFMLTTAAGFFTVDVRYNLGLSNLVNKANRGSNSILVNRYGYIDDNMLMSPISFSVGFYLPKYNPRLKKQYRKSTSVQRSSSKKRKKKSRRKKRGRK
ncbi:hypothetical protein BKI52_16025 [marine bacterium AO1-C]|nr:hypothetical protein BKI52_16025 [marine bacterium AO1-C]